MRDQKSPKKHTIPNETAKLTITCFVYGTLKRGFWNHDRFCRNAIDIRPATTWSRLYQLPAGYPALEVPESAILAHGTADPLADAATQARLAATLPQHAANRPPSGDPPSPQGFRFQKVSAGQAGGSGFRLRKDSAGQAGGAGWDLIHGELITFPDPARDLPPIDRLEGFMRENCSLYRRVLIHAKTASRCCVCWCYVVDKSRLLQIGARRIVEYRAQ